MQKPGHVYWVLMISLILQISQILSHFHLRDFFFFCNFIGYLISTYIVYIFFCFVILIIFYSYFLVLGFTLVYIPCTRVGPFDFINEIFYYLKKCFSFLWARSDYSIDQNFVLYAVICSCRQLPRTRRARKLILLMWPSLIW